MNWTGYLVLGLALVGSLSCKKTEEAASTTESTTSTSSKPASQPDDDAGFSITVPSTKYPAWVHNSTDTTTFSTACKITSTTSDNDILCYVEVRELDLYFHGVDLTYNVPSTMCSYVTINPYYYYKFQSGAGPTAIVYDIDKNGTIGADTDDNGVVNSAGISVTTGGANHGSATLTNGSVVCDYDYQQESGPNCCVGKYQLTLRTWNATASAYDVSVTSPSWGESVSGCISGPGVDSQPKDKYGFPMRTVHFVEKSGLKDVYKVTAPINKGPLVSNVYAANYFATADHGGSSPPPTLVPTMPSGYYQPPAVPQYYEFQCLDRAWEIKARMRVMVREWNLDSEFESKGSGSADTTGAEDAPFGSYPKNDRSDWKDFGLTYPETSE